MFIFFNWNQLKSLWITKHCWSLERRSNKSIWIWMEVNTFDQTQTINKYVRWLRVLSFYSNNFDWWEALKRTNYPRRHFTLSKNILKISILSILARCTTPGRISNMLITQLGVQLVENSPKRKKSSKPNDFPAIRGTLKPQKHRVAKRLYWSRPFNVAEEIIFSKQP